MKNIGIITLHSPMNCGSVLQAHALNYYINNMETFNSYIIDYVPSYMENEGNPLKNLIRKSVFLFSYNSRKRKFSNFVRKFDVLSNKKYKTYKELADNPPKADIYLVGSDQLWNPCFACGNDQAFFLKFVNNCTPKMSYATSLGTSNYSQEQLKEISNKISDFCFVSVREQCSVNQLASIGGINTVCVCDPTLLLSKSYYESIATSFGNIKKPFVAVYLVESSPLLDYVLDFFRKQNYLIVGVGGYLKKYKCDIHFKDAGPLEFLGLIKSASFVVATSFHACVFSHIFNKNFIIIPPKINPERITELLSITGLTDRIITDIEQFRNMNIEINYEEPQKKLDCFIDFSKEVFKKALENVE